MTTLIQPPHKDRLLVSGAPRQSDNSDHVPANSPETPEPPAGQGQLREIQRAAERVRSAAQTAAETPAAGAKPRRGRDPYASRDEASTTVDPLTTGEPFTTGFPFTTADPQTTIDPHTTGEPQPEPYEVRPPQPSPGPDKTQPPEPATYQTLPEGYRWVPKPQPLTYEGAGAASQSTSQSTSRRGAQTDAEPERQRPRRAHRRRSVRLLVTVCAGVMGLVMGDILAATMSLPLLGGPGFTSPSTDTQWVLTAFAVPFAAVLPVAGRIADAVGARRLLTVGLFAFALASAGAMEAPTWLTLLAARAGQGVGAALMVPASLALLLATVPAARQTAAVGIWSAFTGLAGIVAYAGGGWAGETLRAGWRVLFVPSAVAGAFLLCLAVTLPKPKPRTGPLPDIVGSLVLAAGIGMISWTIVRSPVQGWDPYTIASGVGGVLLLLAAVLKSRHHAEPAVDLALWRGTRFTVANVVSALYGLISFPILVIAPLYLTDVWKGTPALLGAALAPIPAGMLVASLVAGKIARRHGPRPIFYIGSLAVSAGCLALLNFAFKSGSEFDLFRVWLPTGIALGLGFGLLQTGTAAAAALTAGPQRYATGVGSSLSAWMIGGTAGLAVTAILLDRPTGGIPVSGYVSAVVGCLVVAVLAGWIGLFFRPARPTVSRGAVADSVRRSPAPRAQPAMLLAAPVPLAFLGSEPTPTTVSPQAPPLATPEEDPYEATEEMLRQMKATTRRIDTLAEALHAYVDDSRKH